MAESPAIIARKAKSLHQGLKDLLKNNDPWHREVEFQRKDLRKKYLTLLLVHPYAKESKDAETHLWMQTSYNFISNYKQRLATLDRAIQTAKQQQQQQQQQQRPGGHGLVEQRKLTQRFKQFLAEEEKFWTQLVVRFHREFDLHEVQPLLLSLGISSAIEEPPPNDTPDPVHAESSAPTPHGRKQALFPPEDGPHPPTTTAERTNRLSIISKALICLGDIARYRESYSGDYRGRSAGRRGRGGGPELVNRPRNYEKAQQCYEKARMLTPDLGNASHQLAILSAYQEDVFTSLVHYYRALCVRHPYETASENLGTVLNKALDQWRRSKREREKRHSRQDSGTPLPKVRVDNLKENVVILHALWFLDPDKMDAEAPDHAKMVAEQFKALIAERTLPIDMISKVVILSEGALWKHRMIRDSSNSNKKVPTSAPSPMTESRIFCHILSIHRTLLEVGLTELAEPLHADITENDLAQRITAVFRRTLPALRIAGKWLKANYKYVVQKTASTIVAVSSSGSLETPSFWSIYAQFYCALIRAFPIDNLPLVKSLLEEDIEMKGFSPLRKTMGESYISGGSRLDEITLPENRAEEQVHPNVEQLMRIHDLLVDANAIVAMEGCPVALFGNRFVLKGIESVQHPITEPALPESDGEILPASPHQQLMDEIRDSRFVLRANMKGGDDSMTEITSRTEDDPVGDAFREALGPDRDIDDDDDEQIVWDPRPPVSPISGKAFPSPLFVQTPKTPVKAPISPIGLPITPTHRPSLSAQLNTTPAQIGTTAQDLLNSIGFSPRSRSYTHQSAVSQPHLLFGSGSSKNPSNSIWTTTVDDQVVGPAGQNGVAYQSAPQPYHPPSQSQSTWQLSQASPSQNLQYNLVGGLPPNNYVPPPQSMLPAHQRVPSAIMPIGHELYSTAAPPHGHINPNNLPPTLADSQYLTHPSVNSYVPTEGALYETPPISHSSGSLQGLHSRHLSLIDDARLDTAYRPLPQAWTNVG